MIALHGAVVNAASWLPLQHELGESVEFFAPDLPGHGAHRNVPFTVEAALSSVDQALASIRPGRPVIVIGDSLGGYLALLAAARAGDRVHAVVAGGASFVVQGFGGLLLKLTDIPLDLLHLCLGEEKSAQLFGILMRRMTDAATVEAIAAGGVRIAARHESINALRNVDILAAVKACKGRVYMVNGEYDIPAVFFTRTFASEAKEGYAVVIPGAWHGCAVSRPIEFADVVRTAVSGAQVDIAHRETRQASGTWTQQTT